MQLGVTAAPGNFRVDIFLEYLEVSAGYFHGNVESFAWASLFFVGYFRRQTGNFCWTFRWNFAYVFSQDQMSVGYFRGRTVKNGEHMGDEHTHICHLGINMHDHQYGHGKYTPGTNCKQQDKGRPPKCPPSPLTATLADSRRGGRAKPGAVSLSRGCAAAAEEGLT